MNATDDPTCVFRARTRLEAPPETIFAFHSDPHNLPVVMPPTLRLVSLKTDGPAQEGRLIELHCRDWFVIPMHWTCRWRTVQPPGLLVDEIVKGPFRVFVHEHRFEPDFTGGCLMSDVVTYAFGRGWWGHLISKTAVRAYLTLLFAYRHRQTRAWARHAAANGPSSLAGE
jgi:ligand-binding SRPBCC domain-containing protein